MSLCEAVLAQSDLLLFVCTEKQVRRRSPLDARLHPLVPSPAATDATKRQNEVQLQRGHTHLTSTAAQSQPSRKVPPVSKGSRRLLVQPLLSADMATFASQDEGSNSKHSAAVGSKHDLVIRDAAADQARKAVRKSLFSSPADLYPYLPLFSTDSSSNRGAETGTAVADSMLGGSQASEQVTQQAADTPQQLSKPALPCKLSPHTSDVPDFSSVFDFL